MQNLSSCKIKKRALKVLELKPLLLQEDMKRHLEQSHKNKHKYEFVLYIYRIYSTISRAIFTQIKTEMN